MVQGFKDTSELDGFFSGWDEESRSYNYDSWQYKGEAVPRSYGFFTDTTLCIGCKACQVACKEWNALPADDMGLRGTSYDNTGDLSATTWRYVHFVEQ